MRDECVPGDEWVRLQGTCGFGNISSSAQGRALLKYSTGTSHNTRRAHKYMFRSRRAVLVCMHAHAHARLQVA